MFDLPDGWARLRAVNKIPEKLRRPVRAALFDIQRTQPPTSVTEVKEPEAPVDPAAQAAYGAPPVDDLASLSPPEPEPVVVPAQDVIDATDAYRDLLVVAIVEDWSFEKPISVETVSNLPGDVYDALTAECSRLNAPDDTAPEEDPTPASVD